MHQKGRTKGAAKRKDENVTHATTTTKKRSVPKGRIVVVVVVVGDGGLFTHGYYRTFVYHTLTGMFQKSIYKYVQNLQVGV